MHAWKERGKKYSCVGILHSTTEPVLRSLLLLWLTFKFAPILSCCCLMAKPTDQLSDLSATCYSSVSPLVLTRCPLNTPYPPLLTFSGLPPIAQPCVPPLSVAGTWEMRFQLKTYLSENNLYRTASFWPLFPAVTSSSLDHKLRDLPWSQLRQWQLCLCIRMKNCYGLPAISAEESELLY